MYLLLYLLIFLLNGYVVKLNRYHVNMLLPFASFFCRAGCPQYPTDHAELEPQLRLENC